MKKYIILFLLLLSLLTTFILLKNKYAKYNLFFILKQNPKIEDIIIDSMSAFSEENNNDRIIYSSTLNTIHPVEISIFGHKREIKLSSLNKKSFIRIHLIIYENKQLKHKIYRLYLLPKKFPEFRATNPENIDKGFIFTSFHIRDKYELRDSSVAIIDTTGRLVYYRLNQNIGGSLLNLRKWNVGGNNILYSFHENLGFPRDYFEESFSIFEGRVVIMDSGFNIVDAVTILPTNRHPAMKAEEHENIVIDKGHYIVFGYYEPENSPIEHLAIIQEIKNKEVIFDWFASDYEELYIDEPARKDGIEPFLKINSISIDPKDNNLVVSFKILKKIVKIDRKTGRILWQLGGVRDDFNLPKELAFTLQHHAQFVGDELVIYDNVPRYAPFANSRIIKLQLDEKNHKILHSKTIPLIDRYETLGSIQILDNDNMIIGCGGSTYGCIAQLVTPDSKVLWGLSNNSQYNSFRSYYYKKID